MKKTIIFTLFVFLELISCKPETGNQAIEKGVLTMEENITLSNIIIIDIYDNVGFDSKFKTGFGFGCIVKTGNKTILFDTGSDSPTLLANLQTAGIKPEEIEIIVLSHIHGDHTGGLLGFLEKNPDVKVYIPSSFPPSFKEQIKSAGATVADVSNPTKIIEGVYSTGELGTLIKEQSLTINSDKGLIVITGCAHPGIVNIVEKAREMFGRNVYLVMGGFHSPPISVAKEFRELGVEKTAPSHCTGDEATEAFADEYKDDFIKSGAGKEIKI